MYTIHILAKSMKTKALAITLLMLALPSLAKATPILFANTYYVAPASSGGSDSNMGTFGSPFLTAQHAYTVAAACGDTIYMRGGTYDGRLIDGRIVYGDQTKTSVALDTIHHAATTTCGSYANGIVIRNYPGEDVHLTATTLGRIHDQMFHIDTQANDDYATPGVFVHDDYYLTLTGEPGHPIDFDGSSMPPGCFVTYDPPEAGECPTMGETPSGDWAGSGCWGGIHSNHIRWWNVKCHDTSGVAITPDSNYIEFDYLEQYGVLHTQGLYLSNGHNYIIDHSYIHDDRCYGAQIYEAVMDAHVDDNIVRNSIFSGNNSMGDCGSGGLVISSGYRDLVYNNCFCGNNGKGLTVFIDAIDAVISNNTITKNVQGVFNAGQNSTWNGNIIQLNTSVEFEERPSAGGTVRNGDVTAASVPFFVDYSADDFTIRSTSLDVIGVAPNMTSIGITTDRLGASRPSSGLWTAGSLEATVTILPSGFGGVILRLRR